MINTLYSKAIETTLPEDYVFVSPMQLNTDNLIAQLEEIVSMLRDGSITEFITITSHRDPVGDYLELITSFEHK